MSYSSFHDEVRIVHYQAEWVQRFRAMKERIIILLMQADIECDVQHVGGTAVPGLCSKSIVDVLVTVAGENLTKAADALAREILCLGEYGRPRRYFFSYGNTEHDASYIHLTTAANQVAFKDMLLTCPELRKKYADLKQQLAAQYPDNRTIYRLKKGAFIEKCLEEGYDVQSD